MLGMMEHAVTIFRSADENAREDATAIAEMLKNQGVSATLLDDHSRGVVEGTWEVRVAAADKARAEQLIASHPVEDEFANPDQSHRLDLVTVFRSGEGSVETEAEALTITSLLEANGIDAIVAGMGVPIPSLGWEVRVAKERADEAKSIIAEARAAGSAAAERAEAETEK